MMKILITSQGNHPCPGGVDTYISSITKILQERGHTVDLLCFSNLNLLPYETLTRLEQTWADLKTSLGDKVCGAFIENEFLKYIHEELIANVDISSYDIIHSQSGLTSYAAKRIRPEIPLVGTIHGCLYSEVLFSDLVPDGEKDLFRRYDEYAISCPTTIITVSSFLNEHLPSIPKEKHEVVFNGVDVDLFKPKLDRSNDPLKIAASGIVSQYKGYDVLMDALRKLKEQKYEFKAAIYGGGEGLDYLENIIGQQRLPVILKGEVSREILASELPEYDIFAQPSRLDNFPFSVIEAMACGCVPIGSRVGGIPDQIDHMTNGILVEPKNVDELAEAIRMLIQDQLLREKMSKQSRDTAIEKFSLETMGRRLEEVYQKTISRHQISSLSM